MLIIVRVHLLVGAKFKWIVMTEFALVCYCSLQRVLNGAALGLACVRLQEVRVATSESSRLVVSAVLMNERGQLV